MDFDQAIDAIRTLEGRLVEVDLGILSPASGNGKRALIRGQMAGLLALREPRRLGGNAVAAAARWHQAAHAVTIRIEPDQGIALARGRFWGGFWQEHSLVLRCPEWYWRFVPLVRIDEAKPR